MVCGKETGHAEVLLVEFDPKVVRYERLLELFFELHEPSHHRPGGQYRSAVFAFDDAQTEAAQRMKDALIARGETVKTEISPASTFWMAEEYHQQYYEKRGLGRPTGVGCRVA